MHINCDNEYSTLRSTYNNIKSTNYVSISKFILLLIIHFSFSQKNEINGQVFSRPRPRNIDNLTIVDSGNIRISYIVNKSEETCDDLTFLEIGENLIKYYSYYVFKSDSLATDWKNNNPKSNVGLNSVYYSKNPFWAECFIDRSENTFTEYAHMNYKVPDYWYTEDLSDIKWEINGDTLNINGYLCQKAIGNFRGRKYTAWFTPEIPLNYGPWKFNGLPGLIMKVYDDENHHDFECNGIYISEEKFPITAYDYSTYGKIERKKLMKLRKDIHFDYLKVIGAVASNPKPFTPKPYNPLELE